MIRHMTAITLLTFLLIGATLKSSEGRRAAPPIQTLGTSVSSQPSGKSGKSDFQGHPAEWWARKTTHWKRAALARGRTLTSHRRANRQRIRMGPTGVARGFLCIHSFEGSWQDPNPPHWGGLQMDRSFMQTYGGPFYAALGTADRWPPFVQLAVAMRAYYSGRGFGPWPNTRRMCGV